ncbi:MAG TPA: phosphopantetheine-binding protein [Pseudonocardiaceae bacterium]|nr:phosphopantetheine-binding protein [Pseudonocardiaceae bacterium]
MTISSPEQVRRLVEQIWDDVLGAAASRREATFYDLGGQSMSAIRIVTRIEDELGVTVDVTELFDDPDLETLVGTVLVRARAARRLAG